MTLFQSWIWETGFLYNERVPTTNFVNSLLLRTSFIIILKKERVGFSNIFSKISQNKRYDNSTRIVPITELWINAKWKTSLKVCCHRTLPTKDNENLRNNTDKSPFKEGRILKNMKCFLYLSS